MGRINISNHDIEVHLDEKGRTIIDESCLFTSSDDGIEIWEPPDDVCPWGHKPIVKDPKSKAYGQMRCTVCGESFQSR